MRPPDLGVCRAWATPRPRDTPSLSHTLVKGKTPPASSSLSRHPRTKRSGCSSPGNARAFFFALQLVELHATPYPSPASRRRYSATGMPWLRAARRSALLCWSAVQAVAQDSQQHGHHGLASGGAVALQCEAAHWPARARYCARPARSAAALLRCRSRFTRCAVARARGSAIVRSAM